MQRGNGPKWIVGAAVAAGGLPASLVVAWVCLPVSRSAGPVQMYALPTGLFSESFSVRTVNTGKGDAELDIDGYVHQKGEEPIYALHCFAPFPPPLAPGQSLTSTVSPGIDHFFAKLDPGLHRLRIQNDKVSGTVETDIWVLRVSGRTLAIK